MKFHPCKVRCLGTVPRADLVPGPRLTLAPPRTLIDDMHPGNELPGVRRCLGPLLHSSLLDEGDPQCPVQKNQKSHWARVGGILQD